MGSITLYTTAEYESQQFDAVLVRERTVVCVDVDAESVRLVPLDKVNQIDGGPDSLLVDTEIPESFYGGADIGFVDVEEFREIREHLTELQDETY